jgi:hypothetical protein
MTGEADKRFLIVVLVFGIVGTAAGVRWLSHGEIVVRRGQTRVGVGQSRPPPAPRPAAPAAGRIGGDHALFYPICLAWVALGVSMVALSSGLSGTVPYIPAAPIRWRSLRDNRSWCNMGATRLLDLPIVRATEGHMTRRHRQWLAPAAMGSQRHVRDPRSLSQRLSRTV